MKVPSGLSWAPPTLTPEGSQTAPLRSWLDSNSMSLGQTEFSSNPTSVLYY